MKWQHICCIGPTLVATACGGGSGGESEMSDGGSNNGPGETEGIYSGISLVKFDAVESLALVTTQGEVTFLHGSGSQTDRDYIFYSGSLTGAGSLPATLAGYTAAGPSHLTRGPSDPLHDFPVQITGVSQVTGMSVNWLSLTPAVGTDVKSTLQYQRSLYERSASLSKSAGVYSYSSGPYTATISINSNGQLTGSDTDGCVLNGAATVPNALHNAYHVTASVDSCASSGAYSGEALLYDSSDGGQDNVLLLAIRSAADTAIAMPFKR